LARIFPSDWRSVETLGAAQREIETLAMLEQSLTDAYTIYHGVHWTRVGNGFSMFGEIDFVVVNPAGSMLLIEQKSGFLKETTDGLVKDYGTKQKTVPVQMARTADAVRRKFSVVDKDIALQVEVLLYCPDYEVKRPAIAGLDPARIVDSKRRDKLAEVIQAILPADAAAAPKAAAVHRFLTDQLQLVADVSALVGRAGAMVTRLSEGLATWARRLDRLEEAFAAGPVEEAWRFDVLIVDEGQDFSEAWRDTLLRLLRENGRAWWLEDPLQNLYGREPVPLPGWVTLRANVNYRSPRDVLDCVCKLLGPQAQLEAGSPFSGSEVEILTYADAGAMIECTKRAITRFIGMGYGRSDIALVSFRGRDRSQLMGFTQIGPHTLRTFTGNYDLFGAPLYSDGEVLLETVYRFKGQSAACVILTEVDFESFDEIARRKLFVGATRARMHLTLIVSDRAAGKLMEVLG